MITRFQPDFHKMLDAVQKTCPNATGAHQQAWPLIEKYVKTYHDNDSENFKIIAAEPEMFYWLDEETLLVGRVDLIGENGAGFFGEWKTANPRKRGKNWQAEWQLSTQSLTYGVLTTHGRIYGSDEKLPPLNRFLVRTVFKSTPPSCEFEWFKYNAKEVEFWRGQLIKIGGRIRANRLNGGAPWLTNFDYCYKYGEKYPCPYFVNKCMKLNWSGNGGVNEIVFSQRVPHLQVEQEFANKRDVASVLGTIGNLVILDATRVETYLNCEEKFRNHYEEGLVEPAGEAINIGSCFHSGIREYYEQMKVSQCG